MDGYTYSPLPIDANMPAAEQAWRHRLNGFGSSYYFTKIILKRKRLTPSLHLPICLSLEKDHLKDVKEYPRDHFKSTIACEGMPIWRVLPFGASDEDRFRAYHRSGEFQCGPIDEFIGWMRKIHNPFLRNLLVSENLENARKLGTRIRRHFESGALFRTLYPEIIPTTSERWTDSSLQIHMPNGQPDPHGEGTFDFAGVGGALQSRHYNGLLLQDDLVGRKAIESVSVMDKTIDYHQLLVGIFDQDDANHEADELVIGNRWGFLDLNSHIREHEPWFTFESHSALGGCCDLHPSGTPIFPEEFSVAKLDKLKRRLGTYKFSCQFLNDPSSPEDAEFQESWLNYYELKADMNGDRYISHEVRDGLVRKNIWQKNLRIAMATDPTHSQNASTGRCRHAIVVWGVSDAGDYYLLDEWAEVCSYAIYFDKIFQYAKKWNLHRVGFETSAGQGLGMPHIEYRSNVEGYRLKVVELKGEVESESGEITTKKYNRISETLGPLGEFGRIHVQRRHQRFVGEWSRFPKGQFKDLLDASAYIPQMLRTPLTGATRKQLHTLNKQMSRLVGQPYTTRSTGDYYGGAAMPIGGFPKGLGKPYNA